MKCPTCGNETDEDICPLCGSETNKVEEVAKKIVDAIEKERKKTEGKWTKDLVGMLNRRMGFKVDILKFFLENVLLSKDAFEIIKNLEYKNAKYGSTVLLPENRINSMSIQENRDYIDKILEIYLEKFDTEEGKKEKN